MAGHVRGGRRLSSHRRGPNLLLIGGRARMRTRAEARRGLAIYLTVLVILSALLEGWIITHGGLEGPAGYLVLPLMYVPLVSSVVARLVGREGFRDVSFR